MSQNWKNAEQNKSNYDRFCSAFRLIQMWKRNFFPVSFIMDPENDGTQKRLAYSLKSLHISLKVLMLTPKPETNRVHGP